MKTLQLTIAIVFMGIVNTYSQTDTLKVKTSAQCDMCKEKIETALVYEKGIKSADVTLTNGLTTVIYNNKKITPQKIREVIVNTGYDADSLKANAKIYEKLPSCCKKPGDPNKMEH